MDLIKQQPETDIPKIIVYTHDAFMPILEAKRAEIEQVPRKTFKYGNLDRHQLDVYYPPNPPANGKTPIFFFVYGGGFTTGDRVLPPPHSLVYPSLGSFFAQRGFLTVIPDYRLVPEVRYPEPAQDIRDAVLWIVQNLDTLSSAAVSPDISNIFMMGHSAGAAHVATLALLPELSASIPVSPRGLVLSGGAYHFEGSFGPLPHYYGTIEQIWAKEPLGLLKALPDLAVKGLPEILMVEAEREPDFLKVAGKHFKEALEGRSGKNVKLIIGKEHNHISPNVALGSGEGEEWAEEVVEWMKAQSGSN